MEHIGSILESIYNDIENPEVFLPLVISNAIICYKLSHENETYWENFGKKIVEAKISNLKDVYMFFIDFLPETSEFSGSYEKKVEHLKEFDGFLEEFFYTQKKYVKNPDIFQKHLSRYIVGMPNPKVIVFTSEIFDIAKRIRFPETSPSS